MISLKTYIPTLAYVLNLTPDALYERQRVLVREGLLTGSIGYGPGTGVQATPPSVAMLIAAAMATDNLSDIGVLVSKLSAARPEDGTCSLTSAHNFGQALIGILAESEIASRVVAIEVVRSQSIAKVHFWKKGRKRRDLSVFGAVPVVALFHLLSIEAHLPGQALQWTAHDLKRILTGAKGAVFRNELEATLHMRSQSESYAAELTEKRRKQIAKERSKK
jgi:hypothetical protein